MTDKMSTKEEYSTYYSSRGVDPAMYDDVKLPSYLMQVIDPEETILELGCGFGQNLRAFMNSGYKKVSGLDVSEQAVAYCQSQGLPVVMGDVMQYTGNRYDCVLMSHVLEHLPKDHVIPMLRKIRNDILTEHGKLVLMVPNAQSNTDCYWAYEDFTHYTLFTAGSVLFVLREAGFHDIQFLDVDGLGDAKGWKRGVRKVLLWAYIKNKLFWNKVTGSAYHAPSPRIFTYEIKCVART